MLPQVVDLHGAAKEEPRFLHGVSKHDKQNIKHTKKKNDSVDAAAHGWGYSFHFVQRHKVRLLGSGTKILTYITNEGDDIKK